MVHYRNGARYLLKKVLDVGFLGKGGGSGAELSEI